MRLGFLYSYESVNMSNEHVQTIVFNNCNVTHYTLDNEFLRCSHYLRIIKSFY